MFVSNSPLTAHIAFCAAPPPPKLYGVSMAFGRGTPVLKHSLGGTTCSSPLVARSEQASSSFSMPLFLLNFDRFGGNA